MFFVFFFFSSRRRHTRSDRDWSSDVCSSDLGAGGGAEGSRGEHAVADGGLLPRGGGPEAGGAGRAEAAAGGGGRGRGVGRGACRGRGEISGVAGLLKKKKKEKRRVNGR